MPSFVCPIDTCKHYGEVDCKLSTVKVRSEAGDFTVNLVCEFFDLPPGKCDFCGKETSAEQTICVDCMSD